MDIAALSMSMSQMSLSSAVSMSVAKISMDTSETVGQITCDMIKSMETSVNPSVGSTIDVRL